MSVYGASATRDRQAWLFGLTGPQFFMVLAAGFPTWMAIAIGQWVALLVLLPLWMMVGLLVCLPIRGHSAVQWVGVLVRHLAGAAFGWSRFQSKAAAGDLDLGDDENVEDAGEADDADLPGVLVGVQIHDGPPMTGQTARPAIIQDHANRTWAATARVIHPGIGMSDDADRFRMGAGLTEMMEAATAGNQIDLIAVQVRTIPDDGTERAEWVRHNARPDEPEVSARVNAQLEALTAGAAVRREAFVTVVVREDVINKDAKRAGRGVIGRARILYSLLGEIEARLTGTIGCTRVNWLDSAELAVAIRTGFEPGDAPALADATIHHRDDPSIAAGMPVAAAGPTNASTALRSYRHGEWESVSSTILLPRKGARMGALARVLVPSQPGERRALTVFYRPVSQQAADRGTGRAQMSAMMAGTLREKAGKVERAKDRQSVDTLAERDHKLEMGRSLVKVSSAVSITVPSGWNVQDFGRRLDASIRISGFTPLPLDGAHDAAFAVAAIPLGVGLPKRRR
ncbi:MULTISPECIES: SCO6880 family protein [unclassified Nocardioides]|uniref:SCO6880 family protein n=1 Tax=unclassified Nocardioides TaxID=2615069 RepID=UPI0009EFEBC8|nr:MULTISPECIES: SCO6880 family protein [unclassified Nocardioides]GAW48021.1 Putative membrane protein [Nocardioides sp. PD653-B2]GAW53676.1 putative membrane protein [Nocardioides sp. PD653]